ncbi:MAG: hypothetical protein ACR2LI_13225 [Propionibacteriaceae bacterium]
MTFSLTRVRLTAAALLALSVALLALTLLDVGGQIRIVLVVAFGLCAPGWAVVGFLTPMRPSLEWSTAIAFSLAVSVLLGTAMLGLGVWRPALGFALLIVVTCCLLTWHLLRPTPRMVGILEVTDEVAAGGATPARGRPGPPP